MRTRKTKNNQKSTVIKIKNAVISLVLIGFFGPTIVAVILMFSDLNIETTTEYTPILLQGYSVEKVTDESYRDYYNTLSTEDLYRISLNFENTGRTIESYIRDTFHYETERTSYHTAYFIESDDIHEQQLDINYIVPAEQTATVIGYLALPQNVVALSYTYLVEDSYEDIDLILP